MVSFNNSKTFRKYYSSNKKITIIIGINFIDLVKNNN